MGGDWLHPELADDLLGIPASVVDPLHRNVLPFELVDQRADMQRIDGENEGLPVIVLLLQVLIDDEAVRVLRDPLQHAIRELAESAKVGVVGVGELALELHLCLDGLQDRS